MGEVNSGAVIGPRRLKSGGEVTFTLNRIDD